MKKKYYYLIYIQFLGYRFHGWMLQPEHKTVQLMINKTIRFVLGHDDFKTLGSSRTDAMVSANHTTFEMFLNEEIEESGFLVNFNLNLPPDIRAIDIKKVDASFNIIQNPKIKEYLYLFSSGEKMHPFAAPFITGIIDPLDIELMKQGAKYFEGEHDFVNYIHKPKVNTQTVRAIQLCEIVENEYYQANFFPHQTFALRIKGKGFARYQIRLMMGQLIKLGKHEITLETIEQSLIIVNTQPLDYIAPPSGLILQSIEYI